MKKTVIITGASGDIGKALAEKFAKLNYNLALCSNAHNVEYDDELKEKFKIDIKNYKMDIADFQQVESVFSKIFADFDAVTALVANAGISEKRKLIIDVTNEEINQLMDVNLKGSIVCAREFVKRNMDNGGKIVFVGSFVANYGCACESVYSASKAGLVGYTKALANELGNFDFTVNIVNPGFIDTKMNNNLSTAEKEDIEDMTPLARLGEAEDVANAVSFLVEDSGNFITGQSINVDGGYIPL